MCNFIHGRTLSPHPGGPGICDRRRYERNHEIPYTIVNRRAISPSDEPVNEGKDDMFIYRTKSYRWERKLPQPFVARDNIEGGKLGKALASDLQGI